MKDVILTGSDTTESPHRNHVAEFFAPGSRNRIGRTHGIVRVCNFSFVRLGDVAARAAGFVNAEHLEAYERAHYWLNYGLFVIVGTDLLFRVVKHMFSRGD